ncbi:hypothetical protein K3G39_10965 [Pontibacter sp. HSC-14F20]|uniref:hypothetical protein n=1 Tax=Pontibacter sp. HSC-14F20 TaxID=2864136 RepID=UPI001C732F49|nr:hypothetical protein [Pontibacter sp. HSC-14F20]MBX0333757.1 hypothetical protein [Pontibacter sp. HSC-14F20]
MKKRTKVILGISISVVAAVVFLIVNGLQLMAIEDHYGDLQIVYYRSETGDLIVDNNKRVGYIKKYSDRIYVEEDSFMKDLYNWVNNDQQPVSIRVYRPEISETLIKQPSYEEIENLIQKQELEPIISI